MQGTHAAQYPARITCIILALAFCSIPAAFAGDILCEGSYGGHLQGLDSDGSHIYWSFTVAIVKTDMTGRVLATVEAPSHQGDLVCENGRLYVAVNLGDFNREPGHADSWVYVYDAGDLSLLARHEVDEVVHGAGGMGYGNGRFIVIGGLPDSYDENYAYEYDRDFNFIRRHVIVSGHTNLGIQTVCFHNDTWWYGCYGYPENPAMLVTDDHFTLTAKLDTHSSVGIAGLDGDLFLQGFTVKDNENNSWTGKARIIRWDRSLSGRFTGAKTE